ncbi:MAG TPA: ROK family protein [Gaiella sp.]|nr:ROK family protein [Gaiella sp.]
MPPESVIGVDVGGTKIRAGTIARDGSVGRSLEVETPTEGPEPLFEALFDIVEELLPEGSSAIGIGIPMNLDRRTGIALSAANLPLASLDVGSRVRSRFDLPVGLENDGNATALAEWRCGAARAATDVVALALGTGVGGGLVLDGRLFRGWAEIGHLVVVADGPPCQGNCHGHGHLETLASGEAARRAAEEIWGGDDANAHRLVRAAGEGDERARDALASIGHFLGLAIGSLWNVFSPDVVVVGGGFGAAAWRFLEDAALTAARGEALRPADESLRVVVAELGDDAGLVGAGLVGFEALDGVR